MDPTIPTCFNEFNSPAEGVPIDEKFVYPFYYFPTQLGLIAAEELKEFLAQQKYIGKNDFNVGNDKILLSKIEAEFRESHSND